MQRQYTPFRLFVDHSARRKATPLLALVPVTLRPHVRREHRRGHRQTLGHSPEREMHPSYAIGRTEGGFETVWTRPRAGTFHAL